jgi:hypothetical protein
MKTITEQTSGCIKFQETDQTPHYIRFYSGRGCFTYLGARKAQPLSLDTICRKKNVIIHEIVHTLGFEIFNFEIILTCFI